ncbi:MAG TPA: outer membrane protein assembly factor BamB [Rhodocyclaceae bacterium]|nr:outer membrane protein assembly factor BamB [Rhodocyclaceae bacterium]
MRRTVPVLIAASLLLAGCSAISYLGDSLSSLNPFASKGPKPAELLPIQTTADVRLAWSANVGKGNGYVFTPAVVGKSVYVAGNDGTVARYDDGVQAWRIKADQPLSAGVGSDGDLVTVGTPKGEVIAFAANDGKLLWRVRVTSEVLAPPAVGVDGVAVKSGDNRIFLLDRKDGARKWFYQRATPPLSLRNTAPPIFADRYLFSGFPGGRLLALDLKNGAPVWEGPVALPKGATELDRVADVVSVPVIDGKAVCAAAYQGRVACFDLGQGGQLLWARDLSSSRGVAVDGRYLFVTDDKGAVHALDRSAGGSLWKQDKLLNRQVSGPAVRRGLVAVGDFEGVVHFLGRDDGAFVARMKTDGSAIQSQPQLAGNTILVQTTGGGVFAFESQ